jgi:hypothetical protein
MTSPRRRQGKPVESVALKITFRADRETAAKIREKVPSAKFRQGSCEVRIEGEQPGEVAEKAREVLEKIRTSS